MHGTCTRLLVDWLRTIHCIPLRLDEEIGGLRTAVLLPFALLPYIVAVCCVYFLRLAITAAASLRLCFGGSEEFHLSHV